jgi:AcrR family transcriptional regulator
VAVVADAVQADPEAPLTIAWMSEVTGIAPMSLYRHFADRDDIIRCVADHLFDETRAVREVQAPWQEQIGNWMRHMYRQSMRLPHLVRLIGSGVSGWWLADAAYLASVLGGAGFGEGPELAQAVRWVGMTTLGHAMIDAGSPHQFPLDTLQAVSTSLPAEDAARLRGLLPELAAAHDETFEHAIEMTIAGLEAKLARLPLSVAKGRP